MDARVNLMAAALIAAFFVMAVGSLVAAWLHARRLDLMSTVISTAFCLITGVLLTGFYMAMEDRRGLVFFGSFFGLIVLPWIATHAIAGPQAWKESSSRRAAAPQAEAPPTITDVTTGVLDALEGKLAAYPDGTYTVTIRFAEAAAAAAFLAAEHRGTPVSLTRVAGHEGVLLETPDSTTFEYQDGARLVRVTGTSRAAVERRLAGPPPGAPSPAGASDSMSKRAVWALFGGILVYGLFVSWVFFRLSTWAATFPALAGVTPAPAETLRARLLEVARAKVPFTVRPGERPDEVIAEWRYADATWLDQMRAHRMTQTIRYRLRLDEGGRTVRVREYRSQFDASAGGGGVSLSYRVQFGGISFFETQRYTVLGLQIKDGRITPDLSYTWRFNLEELRNPLLQIVTSAGWTWRQVVLHAPWLTG